MEPEPRRGPRLRTGFLVLALLLLVASVMFWPGGGGGTRHAGQPATIGQLGVTDSSGVLNLEPRTYRLREPVVVPAGVSIRGHGATIEFSGRGSSVLEVSDDTSVTQLTVVALGRTKSVLTVARGASAVHLEDLTITGSSDQLAGIDVLGDTEDVMIAQSVVSNVRNGVQVQGATKRVTIDRVTVQNWTTRGIRVFAADDGASEDLTITGAQVSANIGSGGSRQPIVIRSSGTSRHRQVRVIDSVVTGRGTSFADPVHPGTGDQISIQNTDDVLIDHCRSVDGGERGISVTDATDVVITNNVVTGSDTVGIGVGSLLPGNEVKGVVVRGNEVQDSGTGTLEDATDYSLSGIRISNTNRGTVQGNTVRKSVNAPTPRYGIVVDSSTDVEVSDTRIEGTFHVPVLDGGKNSQVVLQDPR